MLIPNVAATATMICLLVTCGVSDSKVDGRIGRKLAAPNCPNQVPEPLLWRATKDGRTVYLIASYNLPAQDVTMYPLVEEALSCSDVAYFELACPLTSPGIGHYMAHCHSYSTKDPKDTIDKRLFGVLRGTSQEHGWEKADFDALIGAAKVLWEQAPAECATLAGQLQQQVDAFSSQTEASRLTLLSFHHEILRVLNPKECQRVAGSPSYEDNLRTSFGNAKPTFGLRDPKSECAVYDGNTVEEDQALAKRMIATLSNPAWRANVTAAQVAIDNTMQCGDLQSLQSVDVNNLPYLGERTPGSGSPEIVTGVMQALAANPGKVVAVAVGVTHFLDITGTQSVPKLLQQNGFELLRLSTATKLGCAASTNKASGAEQLGQCLTAPGGVQPASCQTFNKEFIKLRGPDELYGRTKKEPPECITCEGSAEACSCSIVWTNSTPFKDLCETTEVDGVRGQVLYMDLIREPGSVLKGNASAEHKVGALFQMCYATSCDIPLAQDIALREWYQRGGAPTRGEVVLRPAFPSALDLGASVGGIGGSSWFWIALVGGVCISAVLIGVLIKLFLGPKKKQKRGATLQEPGGTQSTVSDGDSYKPVAGHDGYQAFEQRGPGQDYHGEPQMSQPTTPGPQDMYGNQRDFGYPQQPANTDFLQYSQEQASPMKIYDNTLLSQAMQMQQALGDAGTAAVQQMQMTSLNSMPGLGTQQGWQMQQPTQYMQQPLSPGGQLYSEPPQAAIPRQTGQYQQAYGGMAPSNFAPSGYPGQSSFPGQQQSFPAQQQQQTFFGAAPQQQVPSVYQPIAPGGMQQMGAMQGGWQQQQGMYR